MYKYIHDETNRIVYKLPAEPIVTERMSRDRRIGWHVAMNLSLTRANNWLEGGRWKYATSDYREQELEGHYTRESAILYFLRRNEPRGDPIDCEAYERLHAEYEHEAKSRPSGTSP